MALEKTLKANGGSRQLDAPSNTWFFDCKHNPGNVSTWTRCLAPDAAEPSWTTTYDDADSLKPKYQEALSAGWRGVGFWQADGMVSPHTCFLSSTSCCGRNWLSGLTHVANHACLQWPHPYLDNVTIFCKDEMDKQWAAVKDVWIR